MQNTNNHILKILFQVHLFSMRHQLVNLKGIGNNENFTSFSVKIWSVLSHVMELITWQLQTDIVLLYSKFAVKRRFYVWKSNLVHVNYCWTDLRLGGNNNLSCHIIKTWKNYWSCCSNSWLSVYFLLTNYVRSSFENLTRKTTTRTLFCPVKWYVSTISLVFFKL